MKHWYSYAFQVGNTLTSTQIGQKDNHVTLQHIWYAQQAAGVSTDAVMMSCSYLGCMTQATFMGEAE